MDATIVLEWEYSPLDYFEESIIINKNQYEMTIDEGKVKAEIHSTIDDDLNIRNMLHETLNARFLGVQVLTHKPSISNNLMAEKILIYSWNQRRWYRLVSPPIL
jgi:hypothetical protein